MRRIMVERARRRAAIKHGGAHQRVDWDVEAVGGLSTPEEVLSLDEALSVLAARDPRKAEIVHLRFFAGLSIEQTAAALDLSPTTVKEEWSYARAWLRREIRRLGAAPGQGES
jgi:RNA polymerase sigma factor (TIGR02999 family)